jgi:hypothetical protein
MRKIPVLDQPRAKIVSALQAQVRRMEGVRRAKAGSPFSSGCAALDRLLPEKGFSRGVLVEWLARDGGGAGILAMISAREAAREGGAVVVMDRTGSFYPPAAAALAIDLENVIVIRARRPKDEIWALDQALRCAGVAAVWAPLERLDWRSFRRLQLGAETGGAVGLLLRPAEVRGQPSWSDVQLFVEPCGGRGRWRWRVELTRCRGGASGAGVELEIDEATGALREASSRHETHGLHLAAQLAHPAARRRAARA